MLSLIHSVGRALQIVSGSCECQQGGKMHRVAISSFGILGLLLNACASSPDEIDAQYVSPAQYNSYNCSQVEQELRLVSSRVQKVSGQQQEESNEDAVATGVGVVLFWPALFFLADDDREEELSRLKGEYNALEKAAIQKECAVADELAEMKEKRRRMRKENEKESDQDERPSQGPHV